jgi:transketolase
MRKAFAKIVIGLARKDPKLVVLIGDISHYLFKDFEKEFPDRFYNIGICEQTMVSVAAGLAINGMRPIIHTIAPFCVERAYEQIKIDLCYQDLDVTMVSVGGSFDYAHLGCTHHCYEDISILRPLPNMQIYAPGSDKEFEDLFSKSWANASPKYFKLIKDTHTQNINTMPGECVMVNHAPSEYRKRIGEGTSLDQVAVFVNGHLLDAVLDCGNSLEHNIVYMPTIKPLTLKSKEKIKQVFKQTPRVLVVEENSIIGGLADEISHLASLSEQPILLKKIGIPDKFLEEYGKAPEHRLALGLTAKHIGEKIAKLQKLPL